MNKSVVDEMVYLNSCYLRGIGRGNFYAKMNANNVSLLSLKCSNTFFTYGHARPLHDDIRCFHAIIIKHVLTFVLTFI